jgi:hypothetical protein
VAFIVRRACAVFFGVTPLNGVPLLRPLPDFGPGVLLRKTPPYPPWADSRDPSAIHGAALPCHIFNLRIAGIVNLSVDILALWLKNVYIQMLSSTMWDCLFVIWRKA